MGSIEIKKDISNSGLMAYRRDRDQARAKNVERCDAESKIALKTHATSKLKTTMIGGLSKFEAAFGELWGHGKPEEELTDDEAFFRRKWVDVRNEILNQGNNQLRALMSEIDQYTVRFNRYEYNFVIKDEQE